MTLTSLLSGLVAVSFVLWESNSYSHTTIPGDSPPWEQPHTHLGCSDQECAMSTRDWMCQIPIRGYLAHSFLHSLMFPVPAFSCCLLWTHDSLGFGPLFSLRTPESSQPNPAHSATAPARRDPLYAKVFQRSQMQSSPPSCFLSEGAEGTT